MGFQRTYAGCRDKTPPCADRELKLAHQLYFAGYSNTWNAVAFIRPTPSNATTYARMDLITYGQRANFIEKIGWEAWTQSKSKSEIPQKLVKPNTNAVNRAICGKPKHQKSPDVLRRNLG
jgi:hypothetical protein